MPKNNVNDLITDQEITFALGVLSGTMTDRQAAEAARLDANSAAYVKSKPRVRDFMQNHRAAVQQRLIERDVEEARRCCQNRERVLARLWTIADLDPQTTRGSASAQMKAIALIVAIENMIPNRGDARLAGSAHSKPVPMHANQPLDVAPEQADPQPDPVQEESASGQPPAPADSSPSVSAPRAPTPAPEAGEPSSSNPLPTTSSVPRVPGADSTGSARVPFSIPRHFGQRR